MVGGKVEDMVYKSVSITMQNIYYWVFDHLHVVNSPITNDTIIVRDKKSEKTRVGKILLQFLFENYTIICYLLDP